MSIIDALLSEDICEVEDCGNEAFRYCFVGCGWRCTDHYCEHMAASGGNSWLSTDAVVSRMTDAELTSVRLRLQLQISAIDNEIHHRTFNRDRSEVGHHASLSRKRSRVRIPPVPPISNKSHDLIKQFVASLTPNQLKKLEQKLQMKGKTK